MTDLTTKRIVCLANSRKHGGRCIAGIDLSDGGPQQWIRPISARDGHAVSESERRYEDGGEPELLDVLDVPLLDHRPSSYQQENWLLADDHSWRKIRRYDPQDLDRLADDSDTLWRNGDSTTRGLNDRITSAQAEVETSSLKLISVRDVRLRVSAPSKEFRIPCKFRAHFQFADSKYALKDYRSPN